MRKSRLFLVSTLVIMAMIVAVVYGVQAAEVKLKAAIMSAHGMSDSAEAVAKLFNEKYGPSITVEVTPIGFEVLLDKMLTDFSTGTGTFDVYSVGYHWIGTVGNYLTDLEEVRKKYPDVVDQNYDYNDFPKILWNTYATYQGKNIGLPFVDGALTLFYRTDLFGNADYQKKFQEKYGYELKMPQLGDQNLTYKQLYDYAEFFTNGVKWRDGEQYGVSLPAAAGDPLLSTFACFFGYYRRAEEGLKAFGEVNADYGDFFTNDGKTAFNPDLSPIGLKALNDYLNLGKFSPNPVNLDWITSSEPFRSGISAMFIGWGGYWPSINAPDSPVHQKIGVSLMPMPHLGGWNVAINKASKHAKEAYMYIQMLTSKENCMYLFKSFDETPTRISTMVDSELNKKYPDLWVMKPALDKISVRPKLRILPKLEHAMGTILSKAWTGEMKPEVALKECAQEWDTIISQMK
jgi:ABC-type glycerol-3-phosphate transport system substrate-binding protein